MQKRILVTTNIDPRNYNNGRLSIVYDQMNKPRGVEIFLGPGDYPIKDGDLAGLPSECYSCDHSLLISKRLASNMGRELKKYDMDIVQIHFPWQMSILERGGLYLGLTAQFAGELSETLGPNNQVTINYHNILRYPDLSRDPMPDVARRKQQLKIAELSAAEAGEIVGQINANCVLAVENNPAISEIPGNGRTAYELLDLVSEDFMKREGIVTLDLAHAYNTILNCELLELPLNLEWCKEQYGEIPESAMSLEQYIKAVSSKMFWVHLAGEKSPSGNINIPYKHEGLHLSYRSGIDFRAVGESLVRFSEREIIPVMIETKDGHTKKGFAKVIKDYQFLQKMFKGLLINS